MVDADAIGDYVDLEEYGLGVPFGFAVTGVGAIAFSVPGLMAFGAESAYGKIGLAVLVAAGLACVFVAGVSYTVVDTSTWLKTKAEDGPEGAVVEGDAE